MVCLFPPFCQTEGKNPFSFRVPIIRSNESDECGHAFSMKPVIRGQGELEGGEARGGASIRRSPTGEAAAERMATNRGDRRSTTHSVSAPIVGIETEFLVPEHANLVIP